MVHLVAALPTEAEKKYIYKVVAGSKKLFVPSGGEGLGFVGVVGWGLKKGERGYQCKAGWVH
jgi:hypothetical protein